MAKKKVKKAERKPMKAIPPKRPTFPRWLFLSLFALFVLLTVLYYFDSLKRVSIVNLTLTDFDVVNDTTLHVRGTIMLENKAYIPVKFKKVDYDIDIGDIKVADGTLSGDYVPAKGFVPVDFEQTIYNAPSFEAIVGVLSNGSSVVTIDGMLYLFTEDKATMTFKKSFDIKDALKEYLETKVDAIIGRIDNSGAIDYPVLIKNIKDKMLKQIEQL